MPKKIAIVSIIVALMGMAAELVFSRTMNSPMWYYYIKDFCSSLHLNLMIEWDNFGDRDINYINVFFYTLLLTGGVIYAFNKRESRLVRYLFSIIFFSKCIILLTWLVSVSFNYKYYFLTKAWLMFFASLAWISMWIFVSWRILKYFRDIKEFALIAREYAGPELQVLEEASRWQRFFNLIADAITLTLIFMPFMGVLIRIESVRDFLRPLEDLAGPRLGLYFIMVIFQLIYYMFLESIFQASPGKMLSETRVVDENGDRPAPGKIFIRTISRFVPFEGLSMLFGRGWHDDWSDTYVVKEKREGIHGGWYFMIFPLFLILGLIGFIGYNAYEKHEYEEFAKEQFEKKIAALQEGLKTLTTNHVIELNNASEYGSNKSVFLKTENIGRDSITFTLMEIPSDYNGIYGKQVENYYAANKKWLSRIKFSRKQVQDAIRKDYVTDGEYSPYYNSTADRNILTGKDDKGYDFKGHYIKSIEPYFMANIKLDQVRDNNYSNTNIQITFENLGWKADLVSIKSDNGEIDWGHIFPQTIYPRTRHAHTHSINGMGDDIDELDLKLTFKDTIGRVQVYHLTGGPNEAEMKRIK